MQHGVKVEDAAGRVVGVSRKAALQAVGLTILTRAVLLPIPLLAIPPLVSAAVVPATASATTRLAFDASVVILTLTGALPLTVAAFPPRLALPTSALEPEFHELRDPVSGARVEVVYANKGL